MEGGTEEDSIVRSGRLGWALLLKSSSYFSYFSKCSIVFRPREL